MAERILVVGASGVVGSELVRSLREQGHAVRTTTSKATTGTDQVRVNLISGEGVRAAFAGVDRAFLMSPAGVADQHAIVAPLVAAAREHGLKKVVLMSAFGADADPNAPLRRAELELEQSGLAWNTLRPNWFMQNFHTYWLESINAQGVIALPAGDAKVSFIDTRDIAAVAARLLVSEQWNNQAFNLTGPEAIDHAEAARLISEVSGRTIRYADTAPEEVKRSLTGAGLPEAYADFLLLIFGFLKAGYNAPVTDDVRHILGRAPIAFDQYAQDYRAAWR